MDGVVGPIKAYLKKRDPATIDNFAFKLHYRVTCVVMLVCMMLVSARQYIGDPISCIADGVPGGTLDLYCWIHSTFSVPSRWGKGSDEYGVGAPHSAGRSQPHPGIAPPEEGEDVVSRGDRSYRVCLDNNCVCRSITATTSGLCSSCLSRPQPSICLGSSGSTWRAA